MIPKIIHFCWFGENPYPEIVKKSMHSWSKILPEHKISKWNEDNVSIKDHKFMRDAYRLKKYAFVSDYARYLILYEEGGIFLDCDVEIIKDFNALLDNQVILGFSKHVKRNINFVNPGLIIACEPKNPFIKEVLDFYDSISFVDENDIPQLRYSSPRIMTNLLIKKGLIIKDINQSLDGITIYSSDYFDPINPRKLVGNKIKIRPITYAIHHGAASWVPFSHKVRKNISIILRSIFGDKLIDKIKGNEKVTYK